MPFLETDDIGDNLAVLAVGIEVDLRLAGCGQKSPARTQLIDPRAVVYVAGFDIHHVSGLLSRSARVLLSPLRGLGNAFLIHFTLARLVDEREVRGGRLTQCCGDRGEIRRWHTTTRSGGRSSTGSEGGRPAWVPTQASA